MEERIETWEQFTREDPEAMRWFVAPLWESINYDGISSAESRHGDIARMDTFLAVAVEKTFCLQRGARDPVTGKIRRGSHLYIS